MSEQTDQQTHSPGHNPTYLSSEPAYPIHTPESINPQTNLPMIRPYVAEETACPRCGYGNHAHSAECYACGSRLQQKFKQVRCRYCHTNTTNQLVLCPSCGQELQAAPSPLLKIVTPMLAALFGLVLLFGLWQVGNPIAWASQLWQTATSYVDQISRDLEPKPPQISASITPIQDIANMATLPVQSGNAEPIIPAIADGPSELTAADQIAANLAIVNQDNAITQPAPVRSSPTPVAIALSDPDSTNVQELPTATLEPIVLDFAGDTPAEPSQDAIVQNNLPQNNQPQNSQPQNGQALNNQTLGNQPSSAPLPPTPPPPAQNFNQPTAPTVQAVALANTPPPPNPLPQNSIAQNQPRPDQPVSGQPVQDQPSQNPSVQNQPAQNFNLPAPPQDQPQPSNPPINNLPVLNEQSSFGIGGLATTQPMQLPPTPVPPTPVPPTPIPPTPMPPVPVQPTPVPPVNPAPVDPNRSPSEPTLLPPGQIPPTNTLLPTLPPTNTPWPTPTLVPPTATIPPTAIQPTPIPAPPTPLPTTAVLPTVAPQPIENPPTPVPVVPTSLPTLFPTSVPTTEPTPLPTSPPPVQPTVASRIVQNPVDDGGDIQVGAANRRNRLTLVAPANGSIVAGCDQPPILSWTTSRTLDDRHQYIVYIGYVDSPEGNVRWIMNQPFETTQNSWQLADNLCNLPPAEYGYQWRWYVQAIDKDSSTRVAPDTDTWEFVWQ